MIDPLNTAAACLESGHLDKTETICSAVLKATPDHSRGLCLMAPYARAPEYLTRVQNRDLAHLHVEIAVAYRGPAAYAAAVHPAQQVVLWTPNMRNADQTLANLAFYADYHRAMERIDVWLKPDNCVEIGVEAAASMAPPQHPTITVGIDARPRVPASSKTTRKIFAFGGVDCFARRNLFQDIEADDIDSSLIAADHLFEQALRDFINIERISAPDTMVLVDDSRALDAPIAQRECKIKFLIVDVWKLVPILRELPMDANVFIIATPASTLCVVTRLNRYSTVLAGKRHNTKNSTRHPKSARQGSRV